MKSRLLRFIVPAIMLLPACSKDEAGKNYTWYKSLEESFTLNETYINNLIDAASVSYPEIAEMKQYVSGGAGVYRFVYTTEADGEKIDASGLVCLPSEPGEYPVLSFQNGTNTVNNYAPSNFPLNTSYQMVEAVASMGYIVVIPDYPGFGASSSIPHPYLVREPTVTSVTDMFRALVEGSSEGLLNGVTVRNEYYLAGYSQGGWATMALHKALELEFSDDFNLAGSVCGAGPYDMTYLFQSITFSETYPVPAYIGYIINAYKEYGQFTNPVADILNEPYASKLASLYNGTQDIGAINSQLTTSVSGLFTPGFLAGYATGEKYAMVRSAMVSNSIAPWKTLKPLYMVHGGSDTQVNPLVTEYFYNAMIDAGTSDQVCIKEILPGLDHGDGTVPAFVKGLLFLMNLKQ
jgi:pimeloyl-ACP methyl ester carboxylesterase